MGMFLSKSDFKVAQTCPTKLYYKKLKYPSNLDDNPYLEFLADGGYMVETIAKLMFPSGVEVPFGTPESSAAATAHLLKHKEVVLFEATVISGKLMARIDILEKKGNQLRLIEVKAKGVRLNGMASPFRGARGGISSAWRPYIEDVAFQTLILRESFPNLVVTPCLCLVDKDVTCTVETSFDQFRLEPREKGSGGKIYSRPKVTFLGKVEDLRQQPFVKIIEVRDEVEELSAEVLAEARMYAASLGSKKPDRIPPVVGVKCKKCEYRVGSETVEKNGFKECWGALAEPKPHLLDLYRVDALGPRGTIAMQLIDDGKCKLTDVKPSHLRSRVGERQAIQIEWTKKGREFINPELPRTLKRCAYPLHFIDFEASRAAVPYHPGMKPYEQVAFQWSCHTIRQPGEELEHTEWINIREAYPNFEFAGSLKETIGTKGTVFVWSAFERTALRDIQRQMVQYGVKDKDLAVWLEHICDDSGPLVDMYGLCKDYYFHPRMAGSLSIKHVLPAVWFEDAAVRKHPWFSEYLKDGEILDPYKTLAPLPFDGEDEEETVEAVSEGTGAIRTYQEMMFGLRKSDLKFREVQKQLLLNYCKLDTAAMVMIWMHWGGRS